MSLNVTVNGSADLRFVLSERFGLDFTPAEMDRVFRVAAAGA